MELSLLSRCTLTALRKQPESKAVPVLKRLLVIKLQVQRVRLTFGSRQQIVDVSIMELLLFLVIHCFY